MRDIIALALMLVLLLTVSIVPARAQDADALRREMEQMRKQFDAMQEQYKKALDSMSERLERMEKRPEPTVAAPPAPAPPAPATPTPAPPPTTEMVTQQRPPGSEPSPLDLIKPREPFALYERRGPGQLLFDMGVTGDFVGNLTQRNVEKNQGGSFSGLENLFFPREVELAFFGQIDPYARAEVLVETGLDRRGGNMTLSLAEAHLTLLTVPGGFQAKMGRLRTRFGLLNQIHSHDRP